MRSIFEKFDKAVNQTKLAEDVKAAKENGNYEEVPAGNYDAVIESMELGETKDHRPMFKVQMRLKKGNGNTEREYLNKFKNKKPCVFMNRVIYGTKNDANMIASVIGWLNSLGLYEEPVVFVSYSDLEQVVLDAAEDAQDTVFGIQYDGKAFNSISIEEVPF